MVSYSPDTHPPLFFSGVVGGASRGGHDTERCAAGHVSSGPLSAGHGLS